MTAASTRGGCNLLSRVACFRHTRHTAERENDRMSTRRFRRGTQAKEIRSAQFSRLVSCDRESSEPPAGRDQLAADDCPSTRSLCWNCALDVRTWKLRWRRLRCSAEAAQAAAHGPSAQSLHRCNVAHRLVAA